MTGTWQPLTQQPAFNASTMLLLTDGRAMVQENGTANWHALSPDDAGSYENGSWSTLAPMSTYRLYYASGVLRDGRVIVCGGEDSGAGDHTNRCEIYDPTTDRWRTIASPPGWTNVGDAPACVLPDGRFMIGSYDSRSCAIYDPVADAWATAARANAGCNEETWVLLADNTILTVECVAPHAGDKYRIADDAWQVEGTPPVPLVDATMTEIGPAMLLTNGNVIFFGAECSDGHGKTAIYSPPETSTGTGTWAPGPDIRTEGPRQVPMVCNDCPASLLTNGRVLFTAAPYASPDWGSPISFFEYDPEVPRPQAMAGAPTPPNNAGKVYVSRLLPLPSGNVLFANGTNAIYSYAPDGAPLGEWRPTIDSVAAAGNWFDPSYILYGAQLNGLSQANIYGDDCTAATNYPLVRLFDPATGRVAYCRTFDFSTMGVATGPATHSVRFTGPNVPSGDYELVVVANGIPSAPVRFSFRREFKPAIIDGTFKQEFEHLGKEIVEGDAWNHSQWVVDPAVVELQAQVKGLENSVRRLSTLIEAKELPEVGKKVAKAAAGQEKQKRAGGKRASKSK